MCGSPREIAECKVPRSLVHEPIVQTLSFKGQSRLVVAPPQSVILISQEWLTTVARWKTLAQSHGSSSQVAVFTAKRRNTARALTMKNSLPYLPKSKLFWEAMEDIAQNTTLMSGYPLPWARLKALVQRQVPAHRCWFTQLRMFTPLRGQGRTEFSD